MCSRLAVIGTVGVILTACSADDSSSPIIVRDSAGVTIVESMEGLWGEGEGWQLSEQPAVIIGMEDGPDEYSLFDVRAALRLSDGTIVIANAGTDELRYYDSTGVFLFSVGNDGYGPGEFKRISGMWLYSDTLVINDYGQDRVSIFSAAGEYVRTVMLDREPGSLPASAAGVFSDGSILGSTLVFDRETASQEGFRFMRLSSAFNRHSPGGEVLDSIGVFLLTESVNETVNQRTDPSTGAAYGTIVGSGAPFGRNGSTVALGEYVYHGSGESYEVLLFSMDGGLKRIIRRPIPNPPVTDRDRAQFRAGWLEENGDWGRRRVDELVYPETKPAYQTVTVDALGCVWVAENATPEEDNVIEWTVFDAEGRMLGSVRSPKGGVIPRIGGDYFMGVWRTELDVEQVRVYRLFRN